MRFSDIRIGHIYNVEFDPVRDCEFDGIHLAIVLKRNNDNRTFIVMPLTSSQNGEGVNKIKLGVVENLPTSLRSNETYAVFNQIRTVNASRFRALKEAGDVVQVPIKQEILKNLIELAMKELIFNTTEDEKIEILKKLYHKECITQATSKAYHILRLRKILQEKTEEIACIQREIQDIIKDIPYTLEQKQIDDGIKELLDEIVQL
ncbi:MAG: type II toxin-antitoxin system PemK/MazF family toxin [Clostridium sp.]